ncbi:Oxidoreductase ptaJ [Lachnellula suecica]|uniref:Oxidoreductase ptaJ n=1 Tax=Lachnellula suecica TaxID=602035 RepID=A0A8T9CFH3_9HELO|nr:Oxidoreductase ptaJ [Lachnellula suecica]
MAVKKSSQVHLSPEHMGLARIDETAPGCLELASQMLQDNHDKYHMYFRDVAGHNHIPHSILSVIAMGGGPKELRRAYDDGTAIQRPLPPVDTQAVQDLKDPEKFMAKMLVLDGYTTFLAFFEQEIDLKGWKAVVNEYCFSRTPLAEALLSQLFEGLYHPIIHLGFGIEFDQPSIVAEALAHAASHDPGNIDQFFLRSEKLARSGSVKSKPLAELYTEVRDNEKIRGAARLQDGPFRGQGVLKRAMDELISVAAQFQVLPEDLERGTAEMMSCGAYTGAAQKAGKARKIDFFYMHLVTCSISLDVIMRQSWIMTKDKIRLLEWKGRLDLVWYAANGSAQMRAEDVIEYKPTLSKGMDWRGMYKAALNIHDDGHVVKFIRALKNGENVVRPFERSQNAASFPVTGDMWFKMAQICYDSTVNIGEENPNELSKKWVWGAGFEPAWMKIPDLESL